MAKNAKSSKENDKANATESSPESGATVGSGNGSADGDGPRPADRESAPAAAGAEATPSGADGAGAAAASTVDDAEQVQNLTAQVTALQNDLLRKQADFENFRKRMNRDKEEAIKFANSSLLLDLTAVLDDFERALSSAEQSEDFATLHSGLELVEKQLLSTLERKWGLTRFDSAGEPFDPERHQALASEESDEHEKPTVLEEYQKGYMLHGRVVRAARVRVATPAAAAGGGADGGVGEQNDELGKGE